MLIEATVAGYLFWALTLADTAHPVRIGLFAVIVGIGYAWLGMSLKTPSRRWSDFGAEIGHLAEILIGVLLLELIVVAAFRLGLRFQDILLALAGAFLFAIVLRSGLRLVLRILRRNGRNSRYVLLVAARDGAERFRALLGSRPEMGLRLAGTVQPDDISSLQAALRERVVDVLLVVTEPGRSLTQEVVELGRLYGKDVKLLFSVGDPLTASAVQAQEFLGGSLVSLDRRGPIVLASAGKRLLDLLLGTLAMVITSPLLLVAVAAIKRDDPYAPAIYKQVRIGLNGRRFLLYKLRTMVPDAERLQDGVAHLNEMVGGPVFKVRNDPRVTRPGRWIRRLSVDELPQIWNVLRGEMSLVGPRPPLPHEVEQYPDQFRRRLSVRPGITGAWQVAGRNEIQFEEWMRLDLDYIDNWSLGRDLRILAQTIPSVLTGRGAS